MRAIQIDINSYTNNTIRKFDNNNNANNNDNVDNKMIIIIK